MLQFCRKCTVILNVMEYLGKHLNICGNACLLGKIVWNTGRIISASIFWCNKQIKISTLLIEVHRLSNHHDVIFSSAKQFLNSPKNYIYDSERIKGIFIVDDEFLYGSDHRSKTERWFYINDSNLNWTIFVTNRFTILHGKGSFT
jgi:hypothetical protein